MEYDDTRLADYTEDAAPKKRGSFDLPFAILTLLLLTIGVVMVLSASYANAYYSEDDSTYYFRRQLIFALLGIAAAYFASRVPMKMYRHLSPFVLFTAIGLLAIVPFVGTTANNATRWIDIGGVSVQPSEIAKVAVILQFAAMICRYKGRMRTLKYGILPFGGILIIIVALLAFEPHFSAAIIIVGIGIVMLFLGGVRLYWFIGGVILAGGAITALMLLFPYAITRINTWRDPFAASSNEGYQIVQSLYAIGSGGLFGLGLGQGRQKYLYLPEEHNDFIFAVLCEELGYIGAIAVLVLFALLIIRGYWLTLHMRDRYSFLVSAGIITLLAMQVILNVSVVTNLIPCTGISLPFFSYGGTALLIQLAEMGIVLSATRDIPAKE